MKQLLVLASLLLLSFVASSQEVTPCQGGPSYIDEASLNYVYFNLHGINLNKYDWKNDDVNCHISLTSSYYKKAQAKSAGGGILLGLGLSALASGLPLLGYSGAAGALVAGGIAATGGGITLLVFKGKDKKQMNYHLNQVSGYWHDQGW